MAEPNIEKELRESCESIRDDLQAIYDFMQTDDYYKVEDPWEDERTLEHYLQDAFDVEYMIGGIGDYRGVEVLLACGGPNIYIDTRSAYIKGGWGSTRVEVPISYDVSDMVDDYYEEQFRWSKETWK